MTSQCLHRLNSTLSSIGDPRMRLAILQKETTQLASPAVSLEGSRRSRLLAAPAGRSDADARF